MGLRSSVTSVRKRVLHFLICFWKRNCRERQTSLVWPARKIQSPPSLPTDTLLGSQQFNNHICNLWISVLLDIAISYDQLLTCTAKHLEKLHRLLHPFIFRWTSLATASCPTLFFFFWVSALFLRIYIQLTIVQLLKHIQRFIHLVNLDSI